MSQPQIEIGIIGGSGLYEMAGLSDVQEVRPSTPFGQPSDAIITGTLEGRRVGFLPRHGRGHRINPSNVPYQANIFALKSMGAQAVLSVSAVGSLREEIRPLDVVVPDQLLDRTKNRLSTFFDSGIVVHVGFSDPFCPVLAEVLHTQASDEGLRSHKGGTYVAMEGPQFSTRAESELYRSWGASIIGMTAVPEAKLAREAELCYATLACATDYDCWHADHDAVTAEMIIANLNENADHAKAIVRRTVAAFPDQRRCGCTSALAKAIVTAPSAIPRSLKRELAPLLGKYLGEG